MILIWLALGFTGMLLMLLSGKESLKYKIRHFNYPFGILSIVGGFITFVFGLLMIYWLRNEDKLPYGEQLK